MRKYCMIMLWMTSLGCWAQTDSTAVNQLSVDLNFLTHGEACGGGLPRSTNSAPTEDRSSFLYGRTRLNVGRLPSFPSQVPDAGGLLLPTDGQNRE